MGERGSIILKPWPLPIASIWMQWRAVLDTVGIWITKGVEKGEGPRKEVEDTEFRSVCLSHNFANRSCFTAKSFSVKGLGKNSPSVFPSQLWCLLEWFFFAVTSEFTWLLHAQKQFHAESCYKVDQWIRNKPKCLHFRSKHVYCADKETQSFSHCLSGIWQCPKTFQRTVFLTATDKDFLDC